MRGITVTLYKRTQIGKNAFNEPIEKELPVQVHDVLVAPASTQEILDTVNLYGRKAVYTLGIPKSDRNEWENCKVSFFGEDWRGFGIPTEGINELVPTKWNKRVMVERYE